MTYAEIEKRAQTARRLMAEINPEAKTEYTVDQFSKKLCNGLYLGDCQGRCDQLSEKLTEAGQGDAAKTAHEIPLFIFATLDEDETIEFIRRWKKIY